MFLRAPPPKHTPLHIHIVFYLGMIIEQPFFCYHAVYLDAKRAMPRVSAERCELHCQVTTQLLVT